MVIHLCEGFDEMFDASTAGRKETALLASQHTTNDLVMHPIRARLKRGGGGVRHTHPHPHTHTHTHTHSLTHSHTHMHTHTHTHTWLNAFSEMPEEKTARSRAMVCNKGNNRW